MEKMLGRRGINEVVQRKVEERNQANERVKACFETQ